MPELALIARRSMAAPAEANARRHSAPRRTKSDVALVDVHDHRARRRAETSGAQIFAKTASGKTMTVDTHTRHTVLDLEGIIHEREGTPPEHQCLVYAGRPWMIAAAR